MDFFAAELLTGQSLEQLSQYLLFHLQGTALSLPNGNLCHDFANSGEYLEPSKSVRIFLMLF